MHSRTHLLYPTQTSVRYFPIARPFVRSFHTSFSANTLMGIIGDIFNLSVSFLFNANPPLLDSSPRAEQSSNRVLKECYRVLTECYRVLTEF